MIAIIGIGLTLVGMVLIISFIKRENEAYPTPEKVEPVEEKPRKILWNTIKTPDGTILESTHRHDYKTYVDKNGLEYMVDGGTAYLRRNVHKEAPYEELTIYMEDNFTPEWYEKVRQVVKRGGRGKNGDQPLTWVPICEMSDSWVESVITYNEERGMGESDFSKLMHYELKYRKENNITIADE